MDRQDVDFDVAKQFWAAANLVVGFSLAQTVGFALAAASVSGKLDEQIQAHPGWSLLFTALSVVLSVGVVAFCQSAHREIMAPLPQSDATTKRLKRFDTIRIGATAIAGLASVALIVSIIQTPAPGEPTVQVKIVGPLPAK
jgi:hypothetical protein